MMDEKNVFQAIFDFTFEKYEHILKDLIEANINDFPERNWELSPETWEKNLLCFIMYEVVLPDTNMTIAEEFASTSNEISEDLRYKIMKMRNMIRSRFKVLSKENDLLFNVKDMKTGKQYKIKSKLPIDFNVGTIITGRIHPFGDTYQFTGIYLTSVKDPFPMLGVEDFMALYQEGEMERIEDQSLTPNKSFSAIMNRYPIHIVDRMCKEYRIKEKRKKEKIQSLEVRIKKSVPMIVQRSEMGVKEVLGILMGNGGYAKVGSLKGYEDDTTYFKKGKSQTPIGILRKKGVLFVGKMNIKGRRYKTAYIPVEFREVVEGVLKGERKIVNMTLDDHFE